MTPTRLPAGCGGQTVKERAAAADITRAPMRLRSRKVTPTPAVHSAVLSVDGLGGVVVEVLASTPGAHALTLRAAPVPVRQLHRLPGTLRRDGHPPLRGLLVAVAADGGGLHHQRLDFVEDAGAIAEHDAIDEVVARAPDHQRRSAIRVATSLPYTFSAVIADRDWGEGRTVDLSVSGALVQGIEAGLPGDRLRGRLALPSLTDPVRAQLRVMRVTADGGRAVRVDAIHPGDRERIARHIAERQREILRARRAG
jgi:hypothetical protein